MEALALSILRENARRTGRLTDAVAYGERAAALADRVGSPEASSFERTNLAELHLLLGRDGEAERLAVAAEQTARSRAPRTLPYALTALARTRMTWNPPMARALLSRAASCAGQSGEQQALDEVRLATAELALRTGRPEEALSLLGTGAAAPVPPACGAGPWSGPAASRMPSRFWSGRRGTRSGRGGTSSSWRRPRCPRSRSVSPV
ncbi:hypothetical protein [Streptomyces sp. NPDC093089]|uniref:hypothetical protein n=1 Tax=Streptomyces sp. NPDC093089 TaxID=3366024 RepID=UPI003813BEA3